MVFGSLQWSLVYAIRGLLYAYLSIFLKMGMYIHLWNFRNFNACTRLKAPSANGSAPIRSWTERFWSLQARVAKLKKNFYTFYWGSKNLWQEMFELEFGIWNFEIGFWNWVCKFDLEIIIFKFDLKFSKSEKFEVWFGAERKYFGAWPRNLKTEIKIYKTLTRSCEQPMSLQRPSRRRR